jgi:hypothetical protein
MGIEEYRGVDKYMGCEGKDELLTALLRDELITMEAPDPITGEELFRLTNKGMDVFPVEKREVSERLSRDAYILWQYGLAEVTFDGEDFVNDEIVLTPKAYNIEEVLLLPSQVQASLAVIKRAYEKAVAAKS